jgi:hypothetical protein
VSLSATLANQSLRHNLAVALASTDNTDEIIARVRESLGFIGSLEPGVARLVRRCYEKSTRAAFGVEVGLVVGAAVSAWFIREKALSR